MMMSKQEGKFFTLLEIVICVAILSLAAVAIGWEMKGVLSAHHFRKNVEQLLLDLKKTQLIALSNRVDLEIRLKKIGKDFCYQIHSDEPLPCLIKKPMKLKGIGSLQRDKKEIQAHTFTICSSGRIVSKGVISFHKNEQTMKLDLSKTPSIELKPIEPYDS